jgi:hypothetical protein
VAAGLHKDERPEWKRSLDAARDRLDQEVAEPWPVARYGRLAGFLIVGAVAAGFPTYFLEEPRPGFEYWVVVALGAALGVFCLLAPWARLPRLAFHVVMAVAVALVAAGAWATDLQTEDFYSFVVIFAAFVLRSRRAVAAWVGICGLALLAPLIWGAGTHDMVDQTLRTGALTFLRLVVIAIVLVYLREHFEAERRRLDRFAGEVIELTERLERARFSGAKAPEGRFSEEASAAPRRGESSRRSTSDW